MKSTALAIALCSFTSMSLATETFIAESFSVQEGAMRIEESIMEATINQNNTLSTGNLEQEFLDVLEKEKSTQKTVKKEKPLPESKVFIPENTAKPTGPVRAAPKTPPIASSQPPQIQNNTIPPNHGQRLTSAPQGKKGVPKAQMPGVGTMPGEASALSNNVISVNSNQTELVRVSASLTNRIATPFQNPRAIILDGDASVKAVGQSLYIAPNGQAEPISLYVTGGGENDPVISLTLIPTNDLPPQTIVAQLDGEMAVSGKTDRPKESRSPIYTERIVAVLRNIALGNTPAGFAQGALPKSAVDLGLVKAVPLLRYSGPNYDVYRYRVEAQVNQELEMEEAAFWTKGVRAVAFFPSAIVSPSRPTEVFVVADKSATAR